jgi:hypothetical protein
MKLEFIIMNEKPNGRAHNGSTRHLRYPKIQVAALCWKFMLAVFWDLERYLERNTTITSVKYCHVLRN